MLHCELHDPDLKKYGLQNLTIVRCRYYANHSDHHAAQVPDRYDRSPIKDAIYFWHTGDAGDLRFSEWSMQQCISEAGDAESIEIRFSAL
jgi:hypothetical protein